MELSGLGQMEQSRILVWRRGRRQSGGSFVKPVH